MSPHTFPVRPSVLRNTKEMRLPWIIVRAGFVPLMYHMYYIQLTELWI